MGLRRKVDDAVDLLFLHEFEDALKVADVHLHKPVVGLVLDVLQISQVTGIGQFVQVDDPVLRVLVDKQPYYVAANETGAAGDYDGSFHGSFRDFRNKSENDDVLLKIPDQVRND